MRLQITIFLCTICCANCILYSINVIKGPSEKDWKQFKLEFLKTYEKKDEEQKRFKIFKQNWLSIQKHNKRFNKGQETYLQEINRFADLTETEFVDFYGLHRIENITKYTEDVTINKTKSYDNVTDNWDWIEKGAVTSAQDQGECGSCWVFSAIGLLESYHFRKTGKLLDLSEQHIIDCKSNSTCSGGIPVMALQFVKENGIHLESNYPYNGKQNDCQNITVAPLNIYFEDVYAVYGNDDDALKDEIKNQGPLSVCLYATSKWMFYKSGVWYHNECSMTPNHCLLLVGYGTENGNDYWLLKNSWGRQWGLDGSIKIARNRHENFCGLEYGLYLQ